VPLRRQNLGHVTLDLAPLGTALVQPVQQQQHTARQQCLAQEVVDCGLVLMLETEVSIHPVPRLAECLWLKEQ